MDIIFQSSQKTMFQNLLRIYVYFVILLRFKRMASMPVSLNLDFIAPLCASCNTSLANSFLGNVLIP